MFINFILLRVYIQRKMNPLNNLKNLFEKLTKKQILILGSMIPLGIFVGMALRMGFNKINRGLEKYNIPQFSLIDTLNMDTILRRKGEIYADTLIDYHKLSKKEIKFKEGFLFVKNKEISSYKLLKNGIPSEEIFGQNNETKNYFITKDFWSKGFKLNKLELIKYGKTSNFLNNEDSFEINFPPIQNKKDSYEVYTRENDLGNKILDNEQENVRGYLNKILEYKKSLKD